MAEKETADRPILIAHIGDTHLRDTQYAASQRGEDFYDAFHRAMSVEADVYVITGDIFDKPRPSPRVIGQLIKIDALLRSRGKVALAITGNHDWSNPTWLSTLFPQFDAHGDAPLELDKIETCGIVPIDNRTVRYLGYTFTGLCPHSANTFRAAIAEITVQVRSADVVLFHGLVDGVVNFPVHFPDPLRVEELPVSKNNKAWLLGDVHVQGFKEISRPGGGNCLIGYPGSTEMCSASEQVEKSVPIIRLCKDRAEHLKSVPYKTRPFIRAEVRTEEQLNDLMLRIDKVAEQHPVVVVQFSRDVPQTINRIHSKLDAQRAVLRCYPLPELKQQKERVEATEETEYTMEYFISQRFAGREDLEKVALDLLHRGESDANNIVADMIEKRLNTFSVRED